MAKKRFTKYPSSYVAASRNYNIGKTDFRCSWCDLKETPWGSVHSVSSINPSAEFSIYDVKATIDHAGDYITICLGIPEDELQTAFNNQNTFIDIHPIYINVIEAWSLGGRGKFNQELANDYVDRYYPQNQYQFRVVSE